MVNAEYVEKIRAALPPGFRVTADVEGFDYVLDNGKDGEDRIRQGFINPDLEKHWFPPKVVASQFVAEIAARLGEIAHE